MCVHICVYYVLETGEQGNEYQEEVLDPQLLQSLLIMHSFNAIIFHLSLYN